MWQTGSGTQSHMNVNEVVARLASQALSAAAGAAVPVHPNDDVNRGLMGSGPRAGFAELRLPENEPGSSIMPGKVNPTQVEALGMVCAQVMGHDVAIGIAASQGQFELNVYKPLIAHDVLDSLRLLGDAMASFSAHCVEGLEVDAQRTTALLQRSLILVTALTPHIGYDRAAAIAKQAHASGTSLREAALASGHVMAAQFDAWVRPEEMVGPR
jgi:fumarate hydratase, class II